MMRAAILFALASSALACGGDVQGDCLEVCEKSKSCTETEADCDSLCEGVASDAEATGCESQTNDYYACRLDAEACDAAACDAELGEVTVCKLDFCLENPKHRLCDVDG